MLQVFGILLFVLALVVHEAGHAIAMMRRGVEIEEAGIGLPVTGKFKLTLRPKFLPFPVTISPVLLGAYVKPTEGGAKQLEELSYKDQAICYAAGVITNLAFGAVLIIVGAGMRNPFTNHRALVVVLISFAVLLVSVFLRRALSLIMPLLGTIALAGTVYSLVQSLDNVGGPIAVITISTSSTSLFEALLIGGSISIGLAFLNMLPLVPLDGGKVMGSFLRSRNLHGLSNAHETVTGIAFVAFALFVIMKDILSL